MRACASGCPSGVSTRSFARSASRSSRVNRTSKYAAPSIVSSRSCAGIWIGCREVEVRREPPRVAGAQLAQRRSAFEDDAEVEHSLGCEGT